MSRTTPRLKLKPSVKGAIGLSLLLAALSAESAAAAPADAACARAPVERLVAAVGPERAAAILARLCGPTSITQPADGVSTLSRFLPFPILTLNPP